MKKLNFLLLIIFVFLQGCSMDIGLVNEAKIARILNYSTDIIDVSHIVHKYIKKGEAWDTVRARLIKDGFKCYKIAPQYTVSPPQKPDPDLTVYGCGMDFSPWYARILIFFGVELEIYVGIKQDKIFTSDGRIVYTFL